MAVTATPAIINAERPMVEEQETAKRPGAQEVTPHHHRSQTVRPTRPHGPITYL